MEQVNPCPINFNSYQKAPLYVQFHLVSYKGFNKSQHLSIYIICIRYIYKKKTVRFSKEKE